MADKRDYYEILGVSKTATESEIKSAFRKKAKECHPDLHPGDKAKEAQFKELNEAAEILSDADKRAKYDQYGHAAFDPSMGGQDPFSGAGFGGFGEEDGHRVATGQLRRVQPLLQDAHAHVVFAEMRVDHQRDAAAEEVE